MLEAQKYKLTIRQKRMLSEFHRRQDAAAQIDEQTIGTIDSVECVYRALSAESEIKTKALLMLMVRDWLTEVSNFDPISGDILCTGMIDFLNDVAKSFQDVSPESGVKDRVYRIVSHTKEAALAIMGDARNKIFREHAMLPIHSVREVDSNSIQWLSRQPGRTLREKLSGTPYMKAVRRRSSVDIAENRLLKAFLIRLEQVLIERRNFFTAATDQVCEELLVSLQYWLRGEEASEIGKWSNLLPNNTLLQDKNYRKIWDGWLWLQVIDEQILRDSKRIYKDILIFIYWSALSLLNESGRFRTIQQPLGFDYDSFSTSLEMSVQGYLFPVFESRIRGRVKFVKPDHSFGFITSDDGRDLYFNSYNLSHKTDINSLLVGNSVSFIIGRNQLGECADDIAPIGEIIPIEFNLIGEQWNIQVGTDKYLLEIVSGNLVMEHTQGVKKKLKIHPTNLKDIPREVLSFVIDSSFEYFVPTVVDESSSIWGDSTVIDLCSIRPVFINDTDSQVYVPFRLLQQYWPSKNNGWVAIDCGCAKAIALDSGIETVSMRSLFLHSSTLSDAVKSNASMFFAKKLSDYIKADKLTYLVPDWGNDFDLEGVRKSVNLYFDESTPLPKSIAAIFAWQSSKKFIQEGARENDLVLVVDSFDEGISITPIQAIYDKQLDKLLPETQGISWERHPAVIVPNRDVYTAMAHNLSCNNCRISEELLHLFGFDGLVSHSGEMSFVSDGRWYHLPDSIREILTQDLDLNILSNRVINDCLNSINGYDTKVGRLFILPLENIIKKPDDILKDFKWLGSSWSVVKGCQTLERWQNEIGDIALWRDHLPELSIRVVRNGRFEDFYLVKNTTVTPQRGRTVNVPVDELFPLQAGQTHYSFPLLQGKGNKELKFVVYLKSPAFPLKDDTKCKLNMTYTYGADDPYELRFIPLDSAEAGFEYIRAEWRSASEDEVIDLENLPIPDFPVPKNWSDFEKLPREDGRSFSNLLDWVCREMDKIAEIVDFFTEGSDTRIYDDVDYWGWKEDRNGKRFCYLEYDFGNVFFHETNFDRFDPEANQISFDLEEQRGRDGYVARNITLGKSIPKKTVEHFRKSLRFPVLTIWNHDHSLSEPDVPDYFRKEILYGVKKIISAIESEEVPDTLKEEFFFLLCCLHRDAPSIVSSRLLGAVKDKKLLRRYYKNIAFAIGNAELPFQQELLNNVIDPIDNEGLTRSVTMEILSIALWRSKALINKLTKEELETLSKNLYDCLEFDLQKVIGDIKGYQIATLCRHLELLLALLRSRGIEDREFKKIFAPSNDLTKKYVSLVDDISRVVIDSHIELRSRIGLEFEKPKIFEKTPDLLYALRKYLTGDSGANAIMITGVENGE